jgi:uncharacterized repeat protein (TIGR03803 family)
MKTKMKTPPLLPATLITAFSLLLVRGLPAQTFTTLYSFAASRTNSSGVYTNTDGAYPQGELILSGSTLYGTAGSGGSSGAGTVFKVNSDGTGFSALYNFTALSIYSQTNSDGASPNGGLILSGNTLYGATYNGGAFGGGTVFAVNTDGTGFTNLHNFPGSGGANPNGDLILAGSTLYGTTYDGGGGVYSSGNGTVFAVSTNGTDFRTVYRFTAGNFGNSDGANPHAGLTLSGSTLYGTASLGGTFGSGDGTVFAVSTDGTGFTNLHNCNFSDGDYPDGGLILSGSTLYGTASLGGSSGGGVVFAINANGTGYTNLYNFTATSGSPYYTNSEGATPLANLILSGKALFGTTSWGGGNGNGTVFAMNTDATGFTELHTFTGPLYDSSPISNSDGAKSDAGLILSGNTLYGTASGGGTWGNGTIFSLSFQPQLTITPAGTNVILSWPTNFAGFSYACYVLQETAYLGSTNGWKTVVDTNPPVIVNGQIRVTRPMLGPQWSYRLKHL